MKEKRFVYGLMLLAFGCTTRIEVPMGKAAVAYNNDTGEVREDVLKAGQHEVDINSILILYKLEPSQVDFSFDFMFEDASEGQIQFSIMYTPRVDSLAKFYRKYRNSDLHVSVVTGIRSDVRGLMGKFSKDNLESKIVFQKINDLLNSKNELNRFIEINEFVPGRIKVGDK
jgi:hypothetical protein